MYKTYYKCKSLLISIFLVCFPDGGDAMETWWNMCQLTMSSHFNMSSSTMSVSLDHGHLLLISHNAPSSAANAQDLWLSCKILCNQVEGEDIEYYITAK